MSAALEPLDFGVRITRVCDHLASAGYDSLLLTGRENIRWLTGFTGSNGWVLARRDELVLITDGRYGDQAVEQMAAAGVECRVEIGSTRVLMAKHLADVVGVGPLGFEGSHISFADHAALSAAVDVIWMPTNGVIEAARRTKDVGEIQRMAHASAIADTALAVTLPVLLGEPTETQFRVGSK